MLTLRRGCVTLKCCAGVHSIFFKKKPLQTSKEVCCIQMTCPNSVWTYDEMQSYSVEVNVLNVNCITHCNERALARSINERAFARSLNERAFARTK